ncbi:MAG: hypothetical protein NT067_07420 [Candidatus Diapherotrites archaeon]|nr:hypothetical protein [Candidatus Diapherotrites archaeon]
MQSFVGAMTAVLFIGEMFNDLNLALKIFALLTVVSFVFTHLGKSPLSYALIGGICWFVLFDYWKFFGGIFILYTLLTLGISGVLVDFFFVSNMGGGGKSEHPEMDATEYARRAHELQAANEMHKMGGGQGMPVQPGAMMHQGGGPGGAPGGGPGGARPMPAQPQRPMGR